MADMAGPIENRQKTFSLVFSAFFGIDEAARWRAHLNHDESMDLKPPQYWSLPRQSIGVCHDVWLYNARLRIYIYNFVFFQELHGVPQSSGKILWDPRSLGGLRSIFHLDAGLMELNLSCPNHGFLRVHIMLTYDL